jgi:DNA-binding PadR family transcriptional regulator
MPELAKVKAHWFHILLSLAESDLHGTAIMEDVLQRTEGQLRLWPGKLYGALKEMTSADLIAEVEPPPGAPTEGGKRRFYSITAEGRAVLREEVERLAALVRLARARGAGPDPA